MNQHSKSSFPVQDVMRICAGILALIILSLSYMADPHSGQGILNYIGKSFFAFSMSFGAILLIIGLFPKLAPLTMLIGIWTGYFVQLLGTSILIPASFSLVLFGLIIKGPGSYTIHWIMNRKHF